MKTTKRWKPMDVAFADNLRGPRRLVLEVSEKSEACCYTVCTESGGVGYRSENSLRTLEEWLAWIDRFAETSREWREAKELREAKEAARTPFTEPKYWTEFRERYGRTGDPWLKPEADPEKD